MSTPLPENKNLLKKNWQGFQGALLWMALVFCSAFLIIYVGGWVLGFYGKEQPVYLVGGFPLGPLGQELAVALLGAAVITFVVVAAFLVIRCFSNPVYLRRLLVASACIVTLIALAWAEEDWRGKHDLKQFERDWEAKGEKFDFPSFVPPAVPDDQNFALTPIVFTSYGNLFGRDGKIIPPEQRDTNFVDRMEMPLTLDNHDEPKKGGSWENATLTDLKPWQDYYRKLAAKTNFFPVTPFPQTPAQDVLLALSKYDSAIEELRQAAQLPYSRFPLNYSLDPPGGILLPHLARVKGVVLVLELRSIAELQNGQSDKALADIKLSLRLAESIRTEPFIISHLVRIAVLAITLQPIYEGLAENKWSDAQLAELDAELAKLDFLADYQFSVRGERAMGLKTLEYLRRTGDFRILQDSGSITPPSKVNFLLPSAFFYQNELTIARMHQQWTIPNVDVTNRTVSPESVQQDDTAANSALRHFSPYNIFARMLMPTFTKAVKRYTRGQSNVDLARVAIALERYRLAHSNYPDSLDALAPQFMEKVPNDVIGGEPLHYRRTDNSFILYSVGWNGQDDGGVTVQSKAGVVNWDKGDLVWKYPAK